VLPGTALVTLQRSDVMTVFHQCAQFEFAFANNNRTGRRQGVASSGAMLLILAAAVLGGGAYSSADPMRFAGDDVPAGFTVVEGDILVPVESISGTYRSRLWTGGVVPYVFDTAVSDLNRQRMRAAMAEWEAVAAVHFRPRAGEPNYIQIKNSSGNSAAVGMPGGPQPVNIYNWDRKFVLVHELGHTLGLWHEQSRHDRDTACDGSPCVIINEHNISQTACHGGPCNYAFAPRPSPGGELGDYDFDSVMHYSQCAFSINPDCPIGGGETITVPPPNQARQSLIGQLTHLSAGDVSAMDHLYPGGRNCPGRIVSTDPPAFAIDARQPSNADGSDPSGWTQIRLEFDSDPSGMGVLDFAVDSTLAPAPEVTEVTADNLTLTVSFDRRIPPGAWTTLIAKPCCDGVQVGYLPGDANQDGTSTPADILDLIDCLNGVIPCPVYAMDADRSGVVAAPDILQIIDLLNGAGVYPRWLDRSLPRDPDVWVESVRAPIGLIGIPVPGEYQVTVCRNSEGPTDLFVPLSVTVGEPPLTFNNLEGVVLSRNCCETKSVFVPTPGVPFSCGGSTRFPVRACADIVADARHANDCASTQVDIESAYYDLVYEVVDNPERSCITNQVCWDVQVCNTGNVTSLPTTSQTGICPDEGADYFPCVGGPPYPFTVPPIDPNFCWTSSPGFCITPQPGAFRNQFIKAGAAPINADVCLNGNQDDDPITIGYPDLVVRNVSGPAAVCGTQWFDIGFDVCNVGDCAAVGTFTAGGWLSLDGNPFDGVNDIGLGTMLINLTPPLPPEGCRRFAMRTLNLPANAILTTQDIVMCADIAGGPPCQTICEANENNNCGSTDTSVVPLDVGVIDLTAPGNVIGCVGAPTYTTDVRNYSQCDVHNLTVKMCVGMEPTVNCGLGPFPPCGLTPVFDLSPYETKRVSTSIPTPPATGFCGTSIPFNLSGVLLNWADFNNNNNFRNETMFIWVPCADGPGDEKSE